MMPKLKINIEVSPEQAELFARMEAMVLFMSPEQKNFMRATVGGIHDYTKLVRRITSTLEQILETEGTREPRIAEALADMREPAREAVELMHVFRTFLGSAMFAQPGANGETLQ